MDRGKVLGSIFMLIGAFILLVSTMILIFTGHTNFSILMIPVLFMFVAAGAMAYFS